MHFDPSLPLGLPCDASNVGVGAVLFHRFPNGSERQIANASKTLTKSQRNHSEIQQEALAIVYGIKKFNQYLYGRSFILVTDHKPLLALFSPSEETPALAASRLARWAFLPSQFDYKIEFRKTAEHANADALSRLPVGTDPDFDGEERGEDADIVCAVQVLGLQVKPAEAASFATESAKDPVISAAMRYNREGWSQERKQDEGADMSRLRALMNSLSVSNGCLLHGNRVVIPTRL